MESVLLLNLQGNDPVQHVLASCDFLTPITQLPVTLELRSTPS